ncbi:MAG: hypothetical protein KAS97_04025, partial [Candidatus Aminicenantes bacterium]|nr:hypothetical protein [Candidatus Aminicenantes bacterium]
MKIRRRDRKKSIIIFFAMFCFLLSGLIFTEDFQKVKERIIKSSWKRVGFIYIKPSILLKDVGYNSNIYYFDEEETPDWTADAGLKVNFSALLGKRFAIVIEESPYYSFYLENKGLQNFNNIFSVNLYTYLGRFNLKYVYSKNSYLSRPTLEFGNRIITKNDNHLISVEYGNYNGFFIAIRARQEYVNYDNSGYFEQYDVGSRLNRGKDTITLTFNKVIFTRTLFFVKSEYYNLKFKTDTQKNGSGGIFSAGIKFPEVSIVKGQFQIGVKYFTPENSAAEKYSKLNGSGNVSFRLTKKFSLGLSYSIDNMYSYFSPDQYFDLRRYTVSLNYYIGRNIKAGYSFSEGETIYKEITGIETGRKDRTLRSDFRLGL